MSIKPRSSTASLILAWLVCLLAASFYCYEYLLRIEPSVMLPELRTYFSMTASGIGILSAMYYYAYTPLQILVGSFTDYFGPKQTLIVAISLCALGVFLFGSSAFLWVAGLGRLFIGIGSAFAFVGVLKLADITLPKRHFPIFVGFTTSLGMLGAMFGDIGMSHAVMVFGWHKVIVFSAWVGVALLPLFILFVKEKKRQAVYHHAKPALRDFVRSFFVVVRKRQLLLAGLVGCILYLSLTVFAEMWGIGFLKAIRTEPRNQLVFANAMVFCGWLFGGPLHGWLSEKLGNRKSILFFGAIVALISFSAILVWPHMPYDLLVFCLFLFGLSSSAEILCFAIGKSTVPEQLTATAMGAVNFFIMLGGMVLQPLVGILLDHFWSGQLSHGARVYSASDYIHAFWMVPAALVIAAVLSLFLRRMNANPNLKS